jgi:hypothetical protein
MQWNWADGRAYYYGPAGTIGKLALTALFPPAAYVFGTENAALSYIRYNDNPTECNGVLVVVDTVLAVLPFASLAKFGGGTGPMMQGGVQVLTMAQTQLLRQEVATVAVGAGLIPNVFFASSGNGSGDPSGKGGSGGNELKNVYNRKTDAPNWPDGFTPAGEPIKAKVNNQILLDKLRNIEPGKWTKIYENGYLPDGSSASVHYFRSPKGKIFDLWVKRGWS